MATSYTSNKKIGALDSASTPLAATNEIVINQNGDILKTPLSAVEAKVFDAKTATSTPTGTEVVVVRQTDNTLRQVALSDIVPALNITNAKVSASAAIEDTKLATINTAGKVTNNAVQAVASNTANRIVTRDGSGNFEAGTITATLSGNASTATIASSVADGSVTTAKIADGAVTSAKIADGTIVNADINASAGITDGKLATISTSGKVSNSATTATSSNTASAIVARDASGNFSAGTITADVTGNVTGSSGSTTGNAATATAWQTARSLSLTGDITATLTGVNGTANVSAATTLASNSVTTAKIADGNVTAAKIADGNVTAAKIADGNVTAAKIADGNVTESKLASNCVTTTKIADANVTFAKLALPSNFPIQVVQTVKTNTQTIDSTATSWTDVSSLTATLTRRIASSLGAVRIQAAISSTSNNGDHGIAFRIVRGSTVIGVGDNGTSARLEATTVGGYTGAHAQHPVILDFIDNSPGSTSTVTYKIQARIYSGASTLGYINRSYYDTDTGDYSYRTISTMTLTELTP